MDRWLYTQSTINGDPVELGLLYQAQARELLRDALELRVDEVSPDGTLPLRAPIGEGAGVVELSLVIGAVTTAGGWMRLPLRWLPTRDPAAFSCFEGWLDLEPVPARMVSLSLSGRYDIARGTADPAAVASATERLGQRLAEAVAAELACCAPCGAAAPESGLQALKVRDLMTPAPLTLDESLPVRTAALLLLSRGIGGAPVLDGEGRAVGVITESDLLAREAAPRERGGWAARDEHRRRVALTVGEACSRPAITVTPETTAREAARILLDRDISRLVVISADQVVGILTRHDLLKALTQPPSALQRLVDACLAAVGADGIQAEVGAGGQVTLTGTTPRRSMLDAALRAVSPIDGVTDVRSTVRWDTDDLSGRPTETL